MYDPLGQFELQVCPNGRSVADEYFHQGNIWIEGREGSRYTLRFVNRSANRVCVIFSVDGLDTITGQPAGPNSQGYIVNANDSIEIPGWKLNNSTAAEFYFNKIGKSYAAAIGSNTSNIGVIGAMVFREYISQPWQYSATSINPVIFRSSGSVTPNITSGTVTSTSISASAASVSVYASNMPTQDVGTGFGNPTEFQTTQATFIRANSTMPDAMLVVYYNTGKNLQRMGIKLRTKTIARYDNSNATAFPAYQQGCTPPPGWRS